MALGFGKKKGDDAGPQKNAPAAPAGQDSADFDGDTLAFGGQDFEGDTFAFDADPDSLEQFASELEAAAPSAKPAKAPSANAAGTDWDADSLLGDLDEPSHATPGLGGSDPFATSGVTPGHGQPETTLFDDLAMELEGIPGVASDHQNAAAPPVPERRTRRKAVSPDISAPGATVKSLKTPGAKGKLPLVPIVGGVLLLAALGGGGFYMMHQGGSSEGSEDTTLPLPPPHRKHPKPEAPVANGVKPGSAPGNPVPGVKPGSAPGNPVPGVKPVPVNGALPSKIAVPTGKPGIANPMSPSFTPTPPKSSAKEPPLDEATKKLRKLWEEGRDAKHNRDIAAARKFWEEGLKLAPDNKGFKESLAKLDEAK